MKKAAPSQASNQSSRGRNRGEWVSESWIDADGIPHHYSGWLGTYRVKDGEGRYVYDYMDRDEAYARACNIKNSTLLTLTRDGWQHVMIWPLDRRI